MPLVSVIIPTYNGARYIGQAIDSVLRQAYRNFEIIVVDDGSTDDTVDLLRPYAGSINYKYQANKGLAGARNTGIRESKGDYLAFLDSDDQFLPRKLEAQAGFLVDNPHVGLVSGGWFYMDGDGAILSEATPWRNTPQLDLESLLYVCPVLPGSVLVRREWIERAGGFDETFRHVEDWELWLRLARLGCPMAWQEEAVCAYRIHPHSQSRDGIGVRNGFIAVLDKFFCRIEPDDPLHKVKKEIYAEAHLRGFVRESAAGQIEPAMADLLSAIKLQPELNRRDNDKLSEYISATAHSHLVEDADRYIALVLDNLPPELASLQSHRGEFIGKSRMSRFYASYAVGNRSAARRAYPAAVAHDPRWLANRGALRMWLDTVIGRRQVDRIRRIAGRPPRP